MTVQSQQAVLHCLPYALFLFFLWFIGFGLEFISTVRAVHIETYN